MFKKNIINLFCLLLSIFGVVLIGLGAYLLATYFALRFVTIGLIVAGVLALLSGCSGSCKKHSCLVCILLIIITIFLFIAAILSFLYAGALVIALVLIGLAILAINLTTICLFLKLRTVIVYSDSSGCCK